MNIPDSAPPTIDLTIERDGSMFILTPLTTFATAWLEANVQAEPWQWLGASLVVDGRFAAELAVGMIAEGLTLE